MIFDWTNETLNTINQLIAKGCKPFSWQTHFGYRYMTWINWLIKWHKFFKVYKVMQISKLIYDAAIKSYSNWKINVKDNNLNINHLT